MTLAHAVLVKNSNNAMVILPKPMRVVVALIARRDGALLVTQRSLQKPLGGLWEFPGGKIEPNEAPEKALKRELVEELGIVPLDSEYLYSHFTARSGQDIELMVFAVRTFQGEPVPLEGQLDMRWISVAELQCLRFPDANCKIIDLISVYSDRIFKTVPI